MCQITVTFPLHHFKHSVFQRKQLISKFQSPSNKIPSRAFVNLTLGPAVSWPLQWIQFRGALNTHKQHQRLALFHTCQGPYISRGVTVDWESSLVLLLASFTLFPAHALWLKERVPARNGNEEKSSSHFLPIALPSTPGTEPRWRRKANMWQKEGRKRSHWSHQAPVPFQSCGVNRKKALIYQTHLDLSF